MSSPHVLISNPHLLGSLPDLPICSPEHFRSESLLSQESDRAGGGEEEEQPVGDESVEEVVGGEAVEDVISLIMNDEDEDQVVFCFPLSFSCILLFSSSPPLLNQYFVPSSPASSALQFLISDLQCHVQISVEMSDPRCLLP